MTLAVIFCLFATVTTAVAGSHWTVNEKAFQYSMTVYAGLTVDGADLTTEEQYSNYEIAAFVGSECRGVAKLQKKNNNVWQYLRVYSNKKSQEVVNFRVYDSYLNEEYLLGSDVALGFQDLYVMGEPLVPFRLALTTVASNNSVALAAMTDGAPGRTLYLPVQLINNVELSGFAFVISTPYALSLAQAPQMNQQRSQGHTIRINDRGMDGDNYKYAVTVQNANGDVLRGNSGNVLTLPVEIEADAVVGSEHIIRISDVSFTNKNNKTFGCTQTAATQLNIISSNSPDLQPVNVSMRETNLRPGGTVNIDWLVQNTGTAEAAAGWSENIFLCNEEGAKTLIGTTRSDAILQDGGSLSRSATIALPDNLSVDGDVYPQVELTCNAGMGEIIADQGNNIARGTVAATLGRAITLKADAERVSESSTQAVRLTLIRSGNRNVEETFTVTTLGTGLVSCDKTVTIPAGRSGATINVYTINNKVVNTADKEHFTVTGSGYDTPAECDLIIEDDEYLDMQLTLSEEAVTEGGTVQLTITMARAEDVEQTVFISSDMPSRFSYPASVKVPAGETTVTVDVTAIDDNVADVEQVVDFYAYANHYNKAKTGTPLVLEDNDIPVIELSITPSAFSEDLTQAGAMGTITRTTAINTPVIIRLTDTSEGAQLLYPNEVRMEAGERSVQFNILATDNDRVDGDRQQTVKASVYIQSCSCSLTGQLQGESSQEVTILDNDCKSLTAVLSASSVSEGSETGTMLTVTRNDVCDEALTVNLSADDARIQMPQQVTIPAGEASVTVELTATANDITDDSNTVSVIATAEDHTQGTTWLMVIDETLPDAVISEMKITSTVNARKGNYLIMAAGETLNVAVTVENHGNTDLPGQTPVTLYVDGKETSVFYTSVAVAPGASGVFYSSLDIPVKIGTSEIYAHINAEKKIQESVYINNTSKADTVLMKAPYNVLVNVPKNSFQEGEAICVSGEVTDDNGIAVPNAPVNIYVINESDRVVYDAVSNNEGKILLNVPTEKGKTGNVVIGGCYPGDATTEAQAEADIVGMRRVNSGNIRCQVLVGVPYEESIKMQNPGSRNLTGIKVEVLSKPEIYDIDFHGIQLIAGNSDADIRFTLTSKDITTSDEWDEIKVRITSDEGATYDLTVYAYSRDPHAQLKASIDEIRTTMAKGQYRDIDFYISNIGLGETGEVRMLLPENAAWMKGVTPSIMSTMKTGENTKVILRLTATENMKVNQAFTGRIAFNCENGNGITIPYYITPVSKSGGHLTVDVCDESTYYTEAKPHVEGALVEVRNINTDAIITSSVTGKDGHADFELPEGNYKLHVSAEEHNDYEGTVRVDPDTVTLKVVDLGINVVKITWEVTETEVEDKYQINSIMQYNTVVPAPVVKVAFVDKIPIELIYRKGYAICNAVCTNVGLIRADKVHVNLQQDTTLIAEYLGENEFDLGPHQVRNVPIRLSLKKNQYGEVNFGDIPCQLMFDWTWQWGLGSNINGAHNGKNVDVMDCRGNGESNGGGGGDGGDGGSGGGGGGGFGEAVASSSEPTKTVYSNCNELVKVISETAAKLLTKRSSFRSLGEEDEVLLHSTKEEWSSVADKAVASLPGITVMAGETEMYEMTDKVIKKWNEEYPDFIIDLRLTGASDNDLLASRTTLDNTLKLMDECVRVEGLPTYVCAYMKALLRAAVHSRLAYLYYSELYGTDAPLHLNATEAKMLRDHVATGEGLLPEATGEDMAESIKARIDALADDDASGAPDVTKLAKAARQLLNIENTLDGEGYASVQELMDYEFDHYSSLVRENSKDAVCASITLKISQTMTLTRQAFSGLLTVTNGHATRPMRNVQVKLNIKDEDGNYAGSHMFSVEEAKEPEGFHPPLVVNGRKRAYDFAELQQLVNNGQNKPIDMGDLSGIVSLLPAHTASDIYKTADNWELNPNSTGQFQFTFIPTKNAAPMKPKRYSFGGTITYVNPFDNKVITREFYPVTMTVSPTPELDLTYFMQRDIMGDNALTEDVVEPMVPSEFALLINNVGYGDAKNVNIVTDQPEITENKLDLLIDFEILSSSVNGKNKTMALGASVPADFGNIPSHTQSYAQWELQCSLLGHFVNYKVEATHLTSRDNPELSLLRNVTIHELIHSIDAYKTNLSEVMIPENLSGLHVLTNGNNNQPLVNKPSYVDTDTLGNKLVGWLVNDIPDDYDLPDALYFSDGTVEDVSFVPSDSVKVRSIDHSSYEITIRPTKRGWVYGHVADPAGGNAGILSITRKSDGKVIPLRNFWLTDWTIFETGDPLQENVMHFSDYIFGKEETYIVEYEPHPATMLAVKELTGPDPNNEIEIEPLKDFFVKFNKPIDEETFTTDDLKLTLGGKKVDITDTYINNMWADEEPYFHIAFDKEVEANGYYTLTVATDKITDTEGFKGKNGKFIGWTLFKEGLVTLDVIVFPENSGSVVKSGGSAARNRSAHKVAGVGGKMVNEYGEEVVLTAVPNTGYKFTGWYQGDRLISNNPTYTTYCIDDATLRAVFHEENVDLIVSYRENGGTVTGGGTGRYPYGSEVALTAVPAERNVFTGWRVGSEIVSKEPTLRYTLNEDTRLEAEFVREGGRLGDVNVDGLITVSDIVALSNLILEREVDGASTVYADVNEDSHITISDIPGIVNILFDNDVAAAHGRKAVLAGGDVKVGDMETLPGIVGRVNVDYTTTYSGITGMQMDVLLPDGFELVNANDAEGSRNHTVAFNKLRNGYTRVICYSMDNSLLTDGSVLTLAVKAGTEVRNGIYDVPVKGIILGTVSGAGRYLTDQNARIIVGGADGIEDVEADKATDDDKVVDLAGRRLNAKNAPAKGIYIKNKRKIKN